MHIRKQSKRVPASVSVVLDLLITLMIVPYWLVTAKPSALPGWAIHGHAPAVNRLDARLTPIDFQWTKVQSLPEVHLLDVGTKAHKDWTASIGMSNLFTRAPGQLDDALPSVAVRGVYRRPKDFSPEVQKALESAVNKNLAAYGGHQSIPGAAVGVWVPGKGTFVKGFGFSDLSTKSPMMPDAKFRIGSNTKTFVVSVLLQLVDEGKLSLDDKLSSFNLGVKVPNAENITVRELCQMTSGLYEAYDTPEFDKMKITPQTKIDPKTLIEFAVRHPPVFAPGKGWSYSNTNYLLLGLIIEAVTHKNIEAEIRERLLVPLDLRNTSFPIDNPGMPSPFSHGYSLDKSGNWEDSTVLLPPTLSWAAGAMISNMSDMKKWVKAYVTGTTNKQATQRDRLNCVPIGKDDLRFGLGVGCSSGWFGYTGGIPGYNTGAYYFPGKDLTVIVFVNSQREKPSPGVANSIVSDITRIISPENVAFPGKT
jgi:D-alanyl-D-alanine carboxypeptidase